MKIVIAGAGATGFYLAKLLAKEDKYITLIDEDEEILSRASEELDILTIKGDTASFHILEQAEVNRAKLFVAVTSNETSNLLACILAKQLGAKTTIARVQSMDLLEQKNKDKFKQLGVDVVISPYKIGALEIERLLQRASFTDVFPFENGKISIFGFFVGSNSPLIDQPIAKVNKYSEEFVIRGVAMLRNGKTSIPNGNTIIRKGDYLYISVPNEGVEMARQLVGKQVKPIKTVMIVGDTTLALRTAEILEKRYRVKLVVNSEERGKDFLNVLNNTLIINVDPGNIETLKEEGLAETDAFIALTENSETNIIACLMARENGVYKTVSLVDNNNYIHLSQHIGIDTIISTKIAAAHDIFRFVRQGKVEMIGGLHGVDAEIIEFIMHKKCSLINRPLKDMNLPKNSIIAGVIRGMKSFVPNGESQLSNNDKVIVLALPEVIPTIEKIFK